MKRQIFRVEQKTGKMPEIAWKVVFEREIELEEVYLRTDSILQSLRYLFEGENYRVIVICE